MCEVQFDEGVVVFLLRWVDVKVSNWSFKWGFRHLGSVVEDEFDVEFVDDNDVIIEEVEVVIPSLFDLDTGSTVRLFDASTCCWLLDITPGLSGASTYRFCTRSGPGRGEIRLILIGACVKPDKAL